ncbi:butyrophilin subfamily 3 member A3-like isoform X5 [Gallus gallus]|uniref:butyrophilin subfamily 3 member A3-like isoform X5 n=1 Tax=Gallus gallus TaxID=9031 RepID=UPI001AEB5135|nr:butyrophilin subfamily 3 member A3-like isoform X5 [Gallus gallus]
MVVASRFQHTMILHIIFFLQIFHLIKGQFKIIPPNNPVVGVIGKGVVLPCQLEARTISERLSVQWIFAGKSPNIDVTSYDGKNILNPVREDKTYQGRTDFFQTEISNGNVSLHLKNVMISDKGKYICSVFLENWYDEVMVDLDVAAQSEESEVFLDGHVGQGIGLTCKSQGWFPQPEVIWLDSKGQTRKEKVVTQSLQTSSGLFDVVSSMTLEPGSDMEVSCRIVNDLLNIACESRVLISVNSTRKQKEETTRDDLIKNKEDLEKDLDAREKMHIAGCSDIERKLGRIELELDFWKAWDRAAPITVSPECQLLELQVPGAPDFEDNACEAADLSSSSTVPVLVAKEGFAAGKHYWEVDVGQQQDWVLGVIRQKGKQEEQGTIARGDYWALHRSRGVISSIQGNSKPEKKDMSETVIGVLLDLEEAQIFYYGAEQRSNMLKILISFGKESAEMFYPFLSKGEGRFKPVCHQNIPVPLNIPQNH